MNQWAADHTHAVAGGVPILALDMYEHAYHMDYGAAAPAYVDAFMGNVEGAQVYERYQAGVHGASDPFAASQDDVAGAHVLDVRRAGMFDQAETLIPGASWRDPAAVATWAQDVPRDKEIVVYCVYGHEVGRADGTAPARSWREGALPARRNRWLASRRAAGRAQGDCVVKPAIGCRKHHSPVAASQREDVANRGDDDASDSSLCCALVRVGGCHG